MSRAIDDLEHEHEAILSSLKILDGIDRQLTTGSAVDPTDLTAFVGFLKEFADKCHHGKEEGFLFPALVAAGIPEQGGPVGVMLREHAEGRRWIQQLEASIQPTLNEAQFSAAARGYGELLRAHIQKENNVLFPMAERALTADQLETLFAAFEDHEAKVIGAGRHEQLHETLKALKSKYLGQH
jgi:hemerythrin-like domain-containing protein